MGRIKQRCGADPGAIRTRLREVRNVIAQVYAAKLTADAVDDLDNCERSSMEEFLSDSFARQFGLQDLSSGNLKALTMAAAALAPISATCRVFVSIVGDSEPLFGAASGAGGRGGARFGAGGGGGGGGRSGLREICIFSSIGPELLELAAGLCIFSSIRSKSAIARSSSFIV